MVYMKQRLKKGYLQWRCRRGTKELDFVLTRFLDQEYDNMNDQELLDFDSLLETQDTILWYWLSGQSESESEVLNHLVNKINA